MPATKPKPFVFVLMPFDSSFDDTYKLGIAAACNEAGAYCERVDDQIFEERILERIYNQIAKADIVVADMSGRNPNVFYETGYAHALGQRTILLTKKADDIPFDLKPYPHIVYGDSIAYLKDELTRRTRWYIEHPEARAPASADDVAFSINGVSIKEGAFIRWEAKEPRDAFWEFSIDLNNLTDRVVDYLVYDYGVVFQRSEVVPAPGMKCVNISDSEIMFKAAVGFPRLLAHSWSSESFQAVWPVQFSKKQPLTLSCKLKVFSEVGHTETPFLMQLW